MDFNSPPQAPPPQPKYNPNIPPPQTPGSSQNSQKTPSIISISSNSPYQCSSNGVGPGPFTPTETQQQGYFVPGNVGRGAIPQQQVVLVQQQTPDGNGRGRKIAVSAKGKSSGGRKTPHVVQVLVGDAKGDDDVQIVADKGVPPGGGRRSGARGQRLDSLISNCSELSLEDQRIQKTRENEKRRRAAQKDSADRLRELVPGLNDGQSRKVGEGVVMQKSGEYIEEIQKENAELKAKIARLEEAQARGPEPPEEPFLKAITKKEMFQFCYETCVKTTKFYLLMMKCLPISGVRKENLKVYLPDYEKLPPVFKNVLFTLVRDKVFKESRFVRKGQPNSGFVPIGEFVQGGQGGAGGGQIVLGVMPQGEQARGQVRQNLIGNQGFGGGAGQRPFVGKVFPGQVRWQRVVGPQGQVRFGQYVVRQEIPGQVGTFRVCPGSQPGFVKVGGVEGQLIKHTRGDGSLAYAVKLPDGSFKEIHRDAGVASAKQDGGSRGFGAYQGQVGVGGVQGVAYAPILAGGAGGAICSAAAGSSGVDFRSEGPMDLENLKQEEGLNGEENTQNATVQEIKNEVDSGDEEESPGGNPCASGEFFGDQDVDLGIVKSEGGLGDQDTGTGPSDGQLHDIKEEADDGCLGAAGGSNLRGWKISGLGEYQPPPPDDDDDDEDDRGAGGVRVENSKGNTYTIGVRSELEMELDRGGVLGDSNERRSVEGMTEIEKRVQMLTVEELREHDRVFREHPLFKYDFLWGKFGGPGGVEEEVGRIAGKVWGIVEMEREEEERRVCEEAKRKKLDDDDDDWAKKKRGGGRGNKRGPKKK